MRSFSASDILMLFDQGAGLHVIDRALLVLRCALPEADYDTLVKLPLGQRDRFLFEVRQRNFGDSMDATLECPACQERLEFSLSCAALLESTQIEAVAAKPLTIEGIPYDLRCPNSADAAAAAASGSAEAAVDGFLARCLRRADEGDFSVGEITAEHRIAIAAEVAARDPAAEIFLDLTCPACAHGWPALFDIENFLWTEVRARARRLLQEVDALARVYHWHEMEILGLSEVRRGLYLEMALS